MPLSMLPDPGNCPARAIARTVDEDALFRAAVAGINAGRPGNMREVKR